MGWEARWQHKFAIKKQKFEDNPYCHYCGSEMWMDYELIKEKGGKGKQATLDHVIPEGSGGSDDPDNFVICCSNCNSARGRIDYDTFVLAHRKGPDHVKTLVDIHKEYNRFKSILKQKSLLAYI